MPRNEAQEQHSLLDTIFDYIFYFGSPGTYPYKSQEMSARLACRHVVGLGDLIIDISLEVQNEKHNQISHLLDYIAPGPQF